MEDLNFPEYPLSPCVRLFLELVLERVDKPAQTTSASEAHPDLTLPAASRGQVEVWIDRR